MPLDVPDLPPRDVPESQNAAPIYLAAGTMLHGEFENPAKTVTSALGVSATPDKVEKADAAITELAPFFRTFDLLKARPFCNFHHDLHDGAKLLFPELADMKMIVKLLVFRAEAQDRSGDWRGALQSMALANRVGIDAGSDQTFINLLVRVATRSIANRGYESIIGRHSRNPEFLNTVSAQLAKESPLPPARYYLGGEIVFERIGLEKATSLHGLAGEDGQPSEWEKKLFSIQFVKDAMDASLIKDWSIAWAALPKSPEDAVGVEDAIEKMEAAVSSDHSLTSTVSSILLPVFKQGGDAVINIQAHNRLLQTSVALLQARLQKGSMPKSLPSSLGDLAIDPFDGKPLRYHHDDAGFKLYSIGRDRVDNGGKRREPGHYSDAGYDEVVEFR